MLKLFTSLLLVSTALSYAVVDSSSKSWLQGFLRRAKRKAEFDQFLSVRSASPSMFTVLTGSSQVIECEAGGFPSPAIHWLKDGQRLSRSELNYNDVELPMGISLIKSRLYLDNMTSEQAGVYTCVANNSHSSKHKRIKVLVADEIEEREETNQDELHKEYGVKIPPRVTVWTMNTLAYQDTDVRLYCRSEGIPRPRRYWYNSARDRITNSEKYEIKRNGDLVIKSLNWNDMGTYFCGATNSRISSDSVPSFVYPLQPEE